MIVRVLLIFSNDFNARTDKARICFNNLKRKKKKCSFENALVEKSES